MGLVWCIVSVLIHARRVVCRTSTGKLRHRVRYGQVNGPEWSMANGLAQRCLAGREIRWAVHRITGWRAVLEHLEELSSGAGASTRVRGERSRPGPVTEARDQTAPPQAPEGGLDLPASTKKAH